MPGATSHGFPYPLGTDPISDGDDQIKALAEYTDSRLMCWATATITANLNISGNQYIGNFAQVAAVGGMVVAVDGIVVPLKGWHEVTVMANVSGPNTAAVAVMASDGVTQYLSANEALFGTGFGVSPYGRAVVNLTAGTKVKMSTQTGGSGGPVTVYAGAPSTLLAVRFLTPT